MKNSKLSIPEAVCGILAGACNGLFGAGAGMVLAPGLGKFAGLDRKELFPTVLSAVLPMCLVSLGVYALGGELPWAAAWPYLVGSALGGTAAGLWGARIPSLWLHRLMGAILLLGAWRAIFGRG